MPSGEQLLPDHYLVEVVESIPAFAELKKLFIGFCSELWDGTRYELKADRSCLGIEEMGKKVFWLRNCGKPMTSDEVIVSAEREGYRPATLREALAFIAANPDLQLTRWIVVLGSFAFDDGGDRCVPCFGADDGERKLDDGWFDDEWRAGSFFLLVRNSLHASPPIGGDFVDSCFCQPPIIFPTSFNGPERTANFL